MSDAPQGQGWWQAIDGKWYPPQLHPNYQVPPPTLPAPTLSAPPVVARPAPIQVVGLVAAQGKPRKPFYKRWRYIIPAVLVLAVVAAAIAAPPKEEKESVAGVTTGTGDTSGVDASSPTTASSASASTTPAPVTAAPAPVTAAPKPVSNLTPSQKAAIQSAESYLRFMAFSRQGLIDQLSSEYGEQFPVADATFAVDSLNVDWNEQAAKSAQSYLDMMGFSCQGLIDQLSSAYGEQFTIEQATYGATKVGLC